MGYYISNVGSADAFIRDDGGKLIHYFNAKTLTNETLNTDLLNEEVRGGDGCILLGKYYHTSSFKITLKDIKFDFKYMAAILGSSIKIGSANKVVIKRQDGTIELFGVISEDSSEYNAVMLDGTDEIWATADSDEFSGCRAEIVTVDNCRQIVVNCNYKPKELYLVMSAKCFHSKNNCISGANVIGNVIIEVPRFQLDGNLNFPLSSKSLSGFEISGEALSVDGGIKGKYCSKISEVMLNGILKYRGYDALVISNQNNLFVGCEPIIYAVGPNKIPKRMEKYEYAIKGTALNKAGRLAGPGNIEVKTNLFKCRPISITLK